MRMRASRNQCDIVTCDLMSEVKFSADFTWPLSFIARESANGVIKQEHCLLLLHRQTLTFLTTHYRQSTTNVHTYTNKLRRQRKPPSMVQQQPEQVDESKITMESLS
jgi:hypothetical protein